MYLTAQHVQSAAGDEGINSFYFRHGTTGWQGSPPPGIPDQDPGTLVAQSLMVPGAGNRVRSYLDIVAPDDAWDEIRPAFIAFVSSMQLQPFPWSQVSGRCLLRVAMERSVAGQWQREIANLYRAVQVARLGA